MKKYLVFGIAVSSLMIGTSSCSHDSDVSNYSQVELDYRASFIKSFGQPADNQDWGFGNTTASARMTRTIAPDYDFNATIPSRPTTTEMAAENFKENANGIAVYTSERGTCTCAITSVQTVNLYGSNNVVYFTGTNDFSNNSVYIGANSIIYIVKNAQVTIPNGFQAGCKIYIAEGAKLTINNNITTGNVSYYSKGTLVSKGYMVVNGGHEMFFEGGQLEVKGSLFQLQAATFYGHNTTVAISSKMDINHAWINGQDTPSLYYQTGGSFANTNHELICDGGKFYIDVNSHFSSIEVNQLGVLVNKAGTMTSDGMIRMTNNVYGTNGSVMINDGDLVGAYLGTEGSSFFQNNGTTTINANDNGYTIINSNNNTWVNNGTYNTKYFQYTAGSSQVINNCRLNVYEDFDINLGDNSGNGSFQMDSGSGVVTKNLHAGGGFSHMGAGSSYGGGPFYIYMGSGSVFEVTETATINATKADYGFYNRGDDWAVLHANKIQCMPGQENQGFKVTYGGKLAVWSETTHFPQGHDGNPSHPYIDFKNGASIDYIFAENFNKEGMEINIPASTCNPGFKRSKSEADPDPDPDPVAEIRIIAEDLSATESSDFDFNDVVFDVTFTSNTTATITLQAAGGTLPLYVANREVHQLFEVATNVMVNTVRDASKSKGAQWATKDPVSFDISGIDKNQNGKDILIQVKKGDTLHTLNAHTGEPAAKIGVKPTFIWCDEYEAIETRYPLFKDWVQNKDVIWY